MNTQSLHFGLTKDLLFGNKINAFGFYLPASLQIPVVRNEKNHLCLCQIHFRILNVSFICLEKRFCQKEQFNLGCFELQMTDLEESLEWILKLGLSVRKRWWFSLKLYWFVTHVFVVIFIYIFNFCVQMFRLNLNRLQAESEHYCEGRSYWERFTTLYLFISCFKTDRVL